jgi:hypothetical protein
VMDGAVGLPAAGLLIWMLASGSSRDAGTGGVGCFDMMKTAAKRGRSFVV